MENDVPPTDEEILKTIADVEGGLTPLELLRELEKNHTPENVIKGIQRAFDRGIVKLSAGARLIAVEVNLSEAA